MSTVKEDFLDKKLGAPLGQSWQLARLDGTSSRLASWLRSSYVYLHMEITSERLREFQEAYEKDFGEEVSIDEARAMLTRLVTFYELVGRPLPPRREK